ncbi:MAG: hypothetical protein J5I53_02205 [Bradyrhizobiaceae bacterium]|nr:hypothetical protein [Bradyrhizobiaceae bacterium]
MKVILSILLCCFCLVSVGQAGVPVYAGQQDHVVKNVNHTGQTVSAFSIVKVERDPEKLPTPAITTIHGEEVASRPVLHTDGPVHATGHGARGVPLFLRACTLLI